MDRTDSVVTNINQITAVSNEGNKNLTNRNKPNADKNTHSTLSTNSDIEQKASKKPKSLPHFNSIS